MFACSTPAQAQWGGLLNKARKAAGIKTKQEKAVEAEQQRKDSVAKAAAAITTTICFYFFYFKAQAESKK